MMNGRTKIWLIAATLLVILGLVMFIAALSASDWDFSKLSTVKYESNTHYINDEFENISVKTNTADITFLPSEDGKCRVECYEQENIRHTVTAGDGTLTVNVIDERKWYEYIGISFGTPKVTIYLPIDEYASLFIKESTGDIEIPEDFKLESINISVSTGDVKNYASVSDYIKIKTSTGDIDIENITAGAIDVTTSTGRVNITSAVCERDIKIGVSTGKTKLTDVSCGSLISDGDTGDISLENVIATKRFSIERDTGDVNFDASDAADIFIETDTGDVKGSLLSGKVFIVESDTGRIDVPKTLSGGICEISTDTGDIKITVK